MSSEPRSVEELEAEILHLKGRMTYMRRTLRRYSSSAHACGPRCGMPACVRERKIERLRGVIKEIVDDCGRELSPKTLAEVAAVIEATDMFVPHYMPPLDFPEYVREAASSDRDREDDIVQKADLRVRSAGAAGLYAFQPLTPSGWRFVEAFSASVERGRWSGGAFWFPDSISPYDVLRTASLNVVSGIGSTPENDSPWKG